MMLKRSQLSEFRRALALRPEALADLPLNTGWRYMNGEFPKAVRWLLQYPDILRALADDAERAIKQPTQPNTPQPYED
jgi:hypothetical protein